MREALAVLAVIHPELLVAIIGLAALPVVFAESIRNALRRRTPSRTAELERWHRRYDEASLAGADPVEALRAAEAPLEFGRRGLVPGDTQMTDCRISNTQVVDALGTTYAAYAPVGPRPLASSVREGTVYSDDHATYVVEGGHWKQFSRQPSRVLPPRYYGSEEANG